MSKQERIREGVAQSLGRSNGQWGDEFQHNYWLIQADLALDYLHSQGVVIKVDREFPKMTFFCPTCKKTVTNTMCNVIDGGYSGVESLIEEKNEIR